MSTRFHNFTDGNIPSVCDLEFVGNFFTDKITDRKRPSAFLLLVIPNSIAKSIGTKKNFRWFYKRKLRAKKNSRLKYTDRYIPSVIVAYPVNIFQLPVKCRRTIYLFKFVSEWWNADRIYPSGNPSVIVKAIVTYRWKKSVCKCIGDIGSNANGYSSSVNPSMIIFKYFLKNLFRINNIKLYKLIVKKPIMQIKFLLNIKNKKKLNNIHYKLNVFQKKILS